MFEQSVIPRGAGRRPWIVAGVLIAQLLAVGLLVLIPLIFMQVLPAPQLTAMLVAPPPPPPPPPPAATHAAAHVPKVVLRSFDARSLIAPRTIPKHVAIVEDMTPAAPAAGVIGGVPGGVAGGQVGGVVGGILGAVPTIAPPPPPPPPPPKPKPVAAAPTGPVRVGGAVEEARLISAPKPAYPRLAAEARIQGIVVLDAVIGKDGHVEDLRAVSGSPLLMQAAIDAVKQWVYRPTYLNGKAVDIATEVDVHFQLTS